MDISLYETLRTALDRNEPLPDEARALGEALRAEFERDGAHLDQEARNGLFKLRTRLHGLEADFMRNIDQPGPVVRHVY